MIKRLTAHVSWKVGLEAFVSDEKVFYIREIKKERGRNSERGRLLFVTGCLHCLILMIPIDLLYTTIITIHVPCARRMYNSRAHEWGKQFEGGRSAEERERHVVWPFRGPGRSVIRAYTATKQWADNRTRAHVRSERNCAAESILASIRRNDACKVRSCLCVLWGEKIT